jgi:signal transduction histidine kinase
MNMYIYPPLISSILFLALGLFVFLYNAKSVINRTFFLLCLTTFGWQFTWFLLFLMPDKFSPSLMVRIGYSWIIFLPIAYFHFGMKFIKAQEEKNTIRAAYFLGLIFLAANWFTNYFISGYISYSWGYYPHAGIFHPFYLLMLSYLAVRGIYKVVCRVKCEQDIIVKNQIKYVVIAFAFYALAAVDFIVNYNVEFYPPGFIFILISLVIIAYAILRHQLLDIEVIIKKTLVFAGLFGFVFAVIVAVALFVQGFIAQYIPHSRFIALAVSAAIIVFLQQPVYNFLINVTNRYLFQKKYDPRKMLKDFSNEALTILNLDTLCRVTIEALARHLYLSNCAILLLSREEIGYQVYDSSGIEGKGIYFDSKSSLVGSLKAGYQPLLYQSYDKAMQASESAKKDMEKLKSMVCLPLVIHNEMVGILTLGAKKSDQPYDENDIDILTTLMKALSIAISNARLFMQAAQYEKLAAIGTLASAVNHEVCNPLNRIGVQIQAYILRKKAKSFANKEAEEQFNEVEKIMRDIMAEIQKVASITGKLSSFAKPKKVVASKPVDIRESIKDALDVLAHKLQLDRIKIEKNIPANLPNIIADEDQMQEVFFNLLKNAAESIKEKGIVSITAKEDNGRVKIEIKDTGCGVPEDKIDKIFEPFVTTKTDGSGYGLAVVREIILRNRGNIAVKNNTDGGTTFYMDFPKAQEHIK